MSVKPEANEWITTGTESLRSTLALLWLTSFKDPVGVRAWKRQDWDTMERLHAKRFISDPKSKSKSVVLSEEGERRSRELFAKHVGLQRPTETEVKNCRSR